MKKYLFVIASMMVGILPRAIAEKVKMDPPPKVEESTREADKAAAEAASSDADKWAADAKKSDPPKMAEEAAKADEPKKVPEAAAAPEPAAPTPAAQAPAPAVKTYTPRPGLNEMKGKLASKSYDPRTMRLSVDGGYNVEFTYDNKTILVNGGSPVTMDDFEYGDELIVRYAGKDLKAVEVDRVRKAPRPQ